MSANGSFAAMCGRLRVGQSFLHVCSIGRCSHVFGFSNIVRNSVQPSGQAAQLFGVLDRIAQLWYNDAR